MTWPTKKLGEVLELCDAGTWGAEYPTGMPLLRSSNMQNGRLILDDLKYIDVPENKKEYYKLLEGDILVTKSSGSVDHIGKSLYITEEMDGKYGFSNFTQRLRANQKIVFPKWIYFKISNPATRNFLLNASQTTTGLRNLKISLLKELEIPLPTIEIQKKVVKKIEELFAKIAQAQSLRVSATGDTDNLVSATLSKIFDEGRSKGRKEKKLSEVIKIVGGGTPSKNNFSYYKGDIPWATVRDLKNDYVEDTEFKISEKAVKESSTNIIPANNVILVTRVGLGKMSIITRDTAINQDLKALIPRDEGSLDKKFLFWWLKTQMKFIQSQGRGATVMGVRLELINNLTIPLPPIAEQKKIVARMDALTQKVQELRTLQSQTASDLTALKQSILHQAFQGEL